MNEENTVSLTDETVPASDPGSYEEIPAAGPAELLLPTPEDRIAELERTVEDLRRAAYRRESKLRLSRRLRDAGLPENFTVLLLRADEDDLTDEEADERVAAIAEAVREQAADLLRRRAEPLIPELTVPRPLTPDLIRTTPLSALASLL